MKLEEIKSVIGQLSPRERAELNAWLQDWPDDDWDRQMTTDAKNGGKLAKLKRDAETDARAAAARFSEAIQVMISKATPAFWRCFHALPVRTQQLAYKNYQLWLENPYHPSLRFKPLKGDQWSVRVGGHYRATGYFRDNQTFVWTWIGSHEDYNKL